MEDQLILMILIVVLLLTPHRCSGSDSSSRGKSPVIPEKFREKFLKPIVLQSMSCCFSSCRRTELFTEYVNSFGPSLNFRLNSFSGSMTILTVEPSMIPCCSKVLPSGRTSCPFITRTALEIFICL